MTFTNPNINELKTEMLNEAVSRESTTWKPVILIEFGQWQYERQVSGIEIGKRFLGTVFYPGGITKQFLAHVVNDMHTDDLDIKNWKPCHPHDKWEGETGEKKVIDYTRERYKTLQYLDQRMREFKARMVEVIKSDRGADFVDALFANKNVFLRDDFSKKELMPGDE